MGWVVDDKRIWRREGLKVPSRQPKRGRLWLADGSCNGLELVAKAVREQIAAVGAKTPFIEPDSPLDNGHCENFNSNLRGELPNDKIFYSLAEAPLIARIQASDTGRYCAAAKPIARHGRQSDHALE